MIENKEEKFCEFSKKKSEEPYYRDKYSNHVLVIPFC
jgi:hypothetical protein